MTAATTRRPHEFNRLLLRAATEDPRAERRFLAAGLLAALFVLGIAIWLPLPSLPASPDVPAPPPRIIEIGHYEIRPPEITPPPARAPFEPALLIPIEMDALPDLQPEAEPFDREPIDVAGQVVDFEIGVDYGSVPAPPGPAVDDRLYEATEPGVARPQLIHKVDPTYPRIAVASRVEARLTLSAIIDEQGRVVETELLAQAGPRLGFLDAAVEAVQQWRYQPATVDGVPVRVRFTIVVAFELN